MRSRARIKKAIEEQEAILNGAAHNGRHDYTAAGWIKALEWVLQTRKRKPKRKPAPKPPQPPHPSTHTYGCSLG